MRSAIATAVLFAFLAACGEPTAEIDVASGTPQKSTGSVTTAPGDGGKLDGLTLTLTLAKSELAPGEQTQASLRIENETDDPITDPGCWLGAISFGLVPTDEPDAPLDYSIIVDCSGPHTFEPGAEDDYRGHTFRARTIRGDDLPPGDYVAAIEIRGYSERVTAPVTIVD